MRKKAKRRRIGKGGFLREVQKIFITKKITKNKAKATFKVGASFGRLLLGEIGRPL